MNIETQPILLSLLSNENFINKFVYSTVMTISDKLKHEILGTPRSLDADHLDSSIGFNNLPPSQITETDVRIALISVYLDNNRLSEANDAYVVGKKTSNTFEYEGIEKRLNESISNGKNFINTFTSKNNYLGALRIAIETGLYSEIDSIVDSAKKYYDSEAIMEKNSFINSARKIVSKAIEKSNITEFYKYLKNDYTKTVLLTETQLSDLEFKSLEVLPLYCAPSTQ